MNTEKALVLLEKIETDSFIQSLIAQSESKFLLLNVKEPFENFPNYTENLEGRLTSIALSYLSIGCSLAEENQMNLAVLPLEKAASILENINGSTRMKNNFNEYFLLVSSLSYYAARQYSKSFITLRTTEFDSDLNKIVSYFLKRNFKSLSTLLNEVLLNRDFTDSEISKIEDHVIAESRIYTVILSKGISLLLEFIYTGNQGYLAQCKEYLLDLKELLAIDKEPSLWWVVRLLLIIIDGFKDNSLWTNLPIHSNGDQGIISNYILALAFHTNPVVELFNSQKSSLPIVLKGEGGVIAIPTSSGKTRIAEIAMIENLSRHPESLILYLAPYRALASEIEESLLKIFAPLKIKVSQLYGGSQFSEIDKMIVESSSIIIATPEKAKAMIRSNDEIKKSINLVIVDEGHLLGPEIRHIRNELFLEELRSIMNFNKGKILVLSAILPNAEEIAKWVTKDENNIVESKWRPSKQRFGFLEYNGHNVDLRWEDGMSFNKSFITPFEVIKKRKSSSFIFPRNKKQAFALAALKFSTIGTVLVYVGKQNMVVSQARELLEGMQSNLIKHNWSILEEWEMFKLICLEIDGEESEILKLATYGILCHHGGLSNEMKLSTEKLIRRGNPKIIVATSTLAQGVNIGVSTIIITNAYIGHNHPISQNDFWNLAGRAGRSFTDREGKLLYGIDVSNNVGKWKIEKERELALEFFDASKQTKARSGFFLIIKLIIKFSEENGIDFGYFLQLIAENNLADIQDENYKNVVENFFDVIDDTLLSLNIQYLDTDTYGAWVENFFRKSLAYIQAEKVDSFEEERIIEVLKARSEAIMRMSSGFQKELIATGLPLRAGIYIRDNIGIVKEIVQEYINSNKEKDDLLTFLSNTETFVVSLPSQQFKEFTGKVHYNLRSKWIMGEPLNSLNTVEKKICKEFYSYMLPWGINAISKMLSNLDHKEEAKQYEELAILVQVGLPTIKAVKIYLSGITSRIISTELSNFFTSKEINDQEDNLHGFILFESENFMINASPLLIKWIEVLRRNLIPKKFIDIRKLNSLNFSVGKTKSETFNLKKFRTKFYLCSPDFNEKFEVILNFDNQEKLEHVANNYSYYFKNTSSGELELKIRNPYIYDL